MKIKNWTACFRDREKWKKEVVEKAKTFSNKRKFSAWNNNNNVMKCVLFVSVHKILADKFDGKRPRANTRHVWQDNVKINH